MKNLMVRNMTIMFASIESARNLRESRIASLVNFSVFQTVKNNSVSKVIIFQFDYLQKIILI